MNDTNILSLLQTILIWAIPILFAVTVHEVAHGWVASRFGDKTALAMGRLTLNPIKHIDLVGTVIVPLMFLLLGGFIFGWAKPVPVNFNNLRHPKRDMVMVAAAGPAANLVMAFIWVIIAKLAFLAVGSGWMSFKALFQMGQAGIAINLMLMLLNLIPIPPLDGGRVLAGLLPDPYGERFESIEPFGFMILLLLIFTGALSFVLEKPYAFF